MTGRPPEADRVASVVVPCREWTWQVPGTGSDPGTPSPLEPPGPPRAPHTPAAAAPRRAGTGHPITWPVHSLCPPSTVQLTPSQRGLVASYGPHGQHMLDRVQAGLPDAVYRAALLLAADPGHAAAAEALLLQAATAYHPAAFSLLEANPARLDPLDVGRHACRLADAALANGSHEEARAFYQCAAKAGWPAKLARAASDARDLKPCHRAMFAVDIASFGRRNPRLQLRLRAALYGIMQQACGAAGISWHDCEHEDRGDGILTITPAGADIETLLHLLPRHISDRLCEHNEEVPCAERIQVRMAINAGWVFRDAHGVAGLAVVHLFRLLEAPALKAELAHRHGDFAYPPDPTEPALFHQITVEVKETREPAWIWLPASGRASQQPLGAE